MIIDNCYKLTFCIKLYWKSLLYVYHIVHILSNDMIVKNISILVIAVFYGGAQSLKLSKYHFINKKSFNIHIMKEE